jgi:hypothetical protein
MSAVTLWAEALAALVSRGSEGAWQVEGAEVACTRHTLLLESVPLHGWGWRIPGWR